MRWLGHAVLILLAIVAVLAPALWLGRDVAPPRVVRWAVNRAAGVEAIDDLAFRIDDLSLHAVEVVGLRVNRDAVLTAERIRIGFNPAELLSGRLRTVTVTGAVLEATAAPDGTVRPGSLEPLIAAFSSGRSTPADGPPAVRRIELQDAAVHLGGGAAGRLRLEGTVAPTSAGLAASMAWQLAAETDASGPLAAGLSVEAEGRATLDRDPSGVRTVLSIADGRVRRQALEVDGLNGTATVTLPASGSAVVAADLSAARVAAGDTALPAPSVHLRYDATEVSGTVRLGSEAEPEAFVAAVADAPGVEGRRPFRFELRADLARLDGLLAGWSGRPALDLHGTARAEASGSVALDDPTPQAVWQGAVASGGLSVDLADGAVPSLGRIRGVGKLALALAAGRLSLETAEPLTLEVEPDPAAVRLIEVPATVTVGRRDTPFRALLQDPFGDARAEIEGPVAAAATDGANGSVDGKAVFRAGAAGWALERVERATVQAAGIRRAGVDLERLEATLGEITPGPAGPAGRFEMNLRASVPDSGLVGAAVAAQGRVEPGEDGTRVLLSAPARLTVDRLAPATPMAPIERLTARVAASERPVLTVPSDGGPVQLRLPLQLPALGVASAEPGVWRVDLDPLRATVDASLEASGEGRLRVRFAGASAAVGASTVTPAGVTLDGLAADLRMDLVPGDAASGGARLRRLDVNARRVADRSRLARFAPLSLEGVARGAATARSPDRLAFRTTLRGADGAFVLDADGHHTPSTGRGEAELKLFPIRFVPGGLQPADLSPAAAALFRDASGEVSLGGRVRWPGEAVPPDDPLTLTLKDLGFSGSLGTVTGLSGAVAITRVDPPATAPAQELTATAVDVGIPIVAPRIRFRLEPERVLRLESVEARFADGRVSAEDVAVPLDGGRPVPVVLQVENVDAARLAEVIDLDGLSATGTLSGWLPLLWDPKTGLALRQARLTAGAGGGSLRYQPPEGAPALQDSGEQVSLLMRAIRNFVYDSFEVEADGRPGEPFDVKLRLRGANPDLYDGYPIALNVTLTGALDQLFGEIRRNLGLTDVIRRRLEASGGG